MSRLRIDNGFGYKCLVQVSDPLMILCDLLLVLVSIEHLAAHPERLQQTVGELVADYFFHSR